MIQKYRCTALACALGLVMISSSSAGVLALNADAYNDGTPWTGSFSLNTTVGSVTLTADLDYAVFTAAQFNTLFGGSGYVPDSSLVYTYQLINTGTQSITTEIVGLSNTVTSIGTFNIGDVDATTTTLSPDARWDFTPGVASGQSTFGLAFSSPNAPAMGNSLTVSASSAGFLSAFQFGVATPGSIAIPEPSTLLLSLFAVSSIVISRRRKM